MILTADDFTAEQNYFIQRLQRHNRYLHGWGVVSGFNVQVQDGVIVVEPGYAIDCAGNDLLMECQAELERTKVRGTLYVVLEYCEWDSDPVPSLMETDSAAQSAQVYSRVVEGCRVGITSVDPNAGHAGMGPGTPGCGCQHPITIARLVNRPKGCKVTAMGGVNSHGWVLGGRAA